MLTNLYRKILLKLGLRKFSLFAIKKENAIFSPDKELISNDCTNPHDYVSSIYAKKYIWKMTKNYEYVSSNQSEYFIYIIVRTQ